MFNVDPALFFSAQSSLSDAATALIQIRGMESGLTSYPPDFERSGEVEQVLSDLNNIRNEVGVIQRKISNTKDQLCSLDSAFAMAYYSSAMNKFGDLSSLDLNSLTTEQQQYIQMSQTSYENYLYNCLEKLDKEGTLPDELREEYNNLKNFKALRDEQAELAELEENLKTHNKLLKNGHVVATDIDKDEYGNIITTEEQRTSRFLASQKLIEDQIASKKAEIERLQRATGTYQNKWYEDIWESMQKTGAAWANVYNTAANGGSFSEVASAGWNATKQTVATGAVTVRSGVSGVLKLGEEIVDGAVWLGGTAVAGGSRLVGADDFAKTVEEGTMNFTAYDAIGEMNKAFYENNFVGRWINENSNLKYDSAGATAIQNGLTDATLVLGATAATIASGGTATPLIFAAGAAVGSGRSAEEHFQQDDRNFWKDSISIGVDGVLKGISTVGTAKAGASLYSGFSAFRNAGLETMKDVGRDTIKAFNKDAIKHTVKYSGKKIVKQSLVDTLVDPDTWFDTASVVLNDGKNLYKNKDWGSATKLLFDAAGVFGANYLGNLGGGFASGVLDYAGKIDAISSIYLDAQGVAEGKYNPTFKTYREHADSHVYYVTSYVEDLARNVDGINPEEAVFAAISHDLGMKGGYVKLKSTDGKFEFKIADTVDNPEIGNIVRKNHPLNSALYVLTEDIVPEGLDKDVVSLLAMSHSKSTSGITHFDSATEWKNCVDDLDGALTQLNKDRGTSFSLDTKKLYDMIDDPDTFTRLQKEAVIIRDGDAMSIVKTIDGDTLMQDGKTVSKVVNNNPRPANDYNFAVASEADEVAGMSDTLYNLDGTPVANGDASGSVKFHAGELNTEFSSQTDGINYYNAEVNLADPNQIPNCSIFAIKERIGEVNTYTNIGDRKFEIVLPKEAEGTALGNFYEEQVGNIREEFMGKVASEKQGNIISEEIFNRQKNFYDNNLKVVYR